MPLSFFKHVWVVGCSCDIYCDNESSYYEIRTYDAIANRSGMKKMIIVDGYHNINFDRMAEMITNWRDSFS